VEELPPGDLLRLDIVDTGCGMGPEVRAHLFEPFFTTKEPGKGTGMGLAAVYGTVRNHAGAITVASAPGQGTTFSVFLPLIADAAPAAPASASAPIPRQLRILVVDDEAVVRDLFRDMLVQDGHEVQCAADGDGALAIVRSHASRFDLVVLDLMMPGMDGRSCYRALRELDPSLRVLLVSGDHGTDQTCDQEHDPALDFIAKPFSHDALRQRIARLLEPRPGSAGPP
jgi:CheY-like chemotaxis protein